MNPGIAVRTATLAVALAAAFAAGTLYGLYIQSTIPSCEIIPTLSGPVIHLCTPPSPMPPFIPLPPAL